MQNMDNSVFISYRRDVSAYVARAVFQDLRFNGINAFMDVESIDSGQFDTIILNQIAARPYFLLILTPGTLDRCVESGDWLLREIDYALKIQRRIIPLIANRFNFEDASKFLHEPLKTELPRWNGVNVPYDYFEEAMNRLRTRFLKPTDLHLSPIPKAEQVEVDRKLEQIDAEPAVTEQQLTAQEYFDRAKARSDKDSDGKIADYSEAIRLNPEYAQAYNNRGIAYYAKGEIDTALDNYNEAIRLEPNYAGTFVNRGLIRKAKGDLDGAIADYNEAIRLDPDYAFTYNNRGTIRKAKGDIDGAIADYTRSIELKNSQLHIPYNNRGAAHLAKGDSNAAIADYSEAINLNPQFAEAYFNRAVVYQRKHDDRLAAADYAKMLELNPNDPDAKSLRSYIEKYRV